MTLLIIFDFKVFKQRCKAQIKVGNPAMKYIEFVEKKVDRFGKVFVKPLLILSQKKQACTLTFLIIFIAKSLGN